MLVLAAVAEDGHPFGQAFAQQPEAKPATDGQPPHVMEVAILVEGE